MKKLQRWSTEMRHNLEYLLKQGYGSAEICEKLVVPTTALYKELLMFWFILAISVSFGALLTSKM